MIRVRVLLPLALAAVLCAGCESGALQGGADKAVRAVEKLMGVPDDPAEHLAVLLAVHEDRGWQFRRDLDDPLGLATDAIRELPQCSYDDWAEVGQVVLLLSEISQEHPAGLVRAAAVDALAQVAGWPEFERVRTDGTVAESELIRAVKQIREAYEYDAMNPARTFAVADAMRTASAFPYFQGAGVRGVPRRAALSNYGTGLRTARAVLNAFTDARVQGFASDPEVFSALEAGYVAVSKSALNLTLLERGLADPSPENRVGALRHLAALQSDGAADVVVRGVLEDEDRTVRREAIWILADGFPQAVAVPALIDALADDMGAVRSGAARALARVTGQDHGVDRRAWTRWWRSHGGAGAGTETTESAR